MKNLSQQMETIIVAFLQSFIVQVAVQFFASGQKAATTFHFAPFINLWLSFEVCVVHLRNVYFSN